MVPHSIKLTSGKMANSTFAARWEQRFFAATTLALGLITLVWHNDPSGGLPRFAGYAAAVSLVLGGVALQFHRSAKPGAIALVAGYALTCALCFPGIVAAPRVYNSYGNFFEQFSLLSGGGIIFMAAMPVWPLATQQRIARICLGLCAASFAAEQALYLDATAGLVPRWIPPSPRFWAVATTIFFAAAALALLADRAALLATRLLVAMIAGFGVLVWLPLLVSKPRTHFIWTETAETFAIAGAMWLLADLLAPRPRSPQV